MEVNYPPYDVQCVVRVYLSWQFSFPGERYGRKWRYLASVSIASSYTQSMTSKAKFRSLVDHFPCKIFSRSNIQNIASYNVNIFSLVLIIHWVASWTSISLYFFNRVKGVILFLFLQVWNYCVFSAIIIQGVLEGLLKSIQDDMSSAWISFKKLFSVTKFKSGSICRLLVLL